MTNEAITDGVVRDLLREHGYNDGAIIEPQSTKNANIARLLAKASKNAATNGTPGIGRPDFIITIPTAPNFVIIMELKGDTSKHESANRDRLKDYAVDGVLHYARFLAPEYTVIAIAVSGTDLAHLKVTTFIQAKGDLEEKLLRGSDDKPIPGILDLPLLINAARRDKRVEAAREQSITDFSKALHEFIYAYVPLSEERKPLLVAGTLIALRDQSFRGSYASITDTSFLKAMWLKAIENEIDKVQVPTEFGKKDIVKASYQGIASETVLDKLEEKGRRFDRGILFEVIRLVEEHLAVLIDPDSNQFFDVIGKFYGQFLKYTGGDKKALGIVLTPRHITDLFCDIAELDVNNGDKVIDPCTGTGAFLISAMGKLSSQTEDPAVRERIRSESLIGIEQNTQMYTLAASNMVLHGDGRSNLYSGSCFDEGIIKAVTAKQARVGFINPPYAQDRKVTVMSEMHFIENMLDMLTPGGIGVAIVPMSQATAPSIAKTNILARHTLLAVMSMPTELFYPVGVVTCIMVFAAHKPHETTNRDTWFGYWKEDGFVKTKTKGRIDLDDRWDTIRAEWLDAFHNRRVVPGHSVLKRVTSVDEWCAEAYMETD